MKLFLLILGIVVVALNVFLWYSKKHGRTSENDKSPANPKKSKASQADSANFLDSPEADALKQAAANELGIPVEKLNRMSVEEIAHLATEKGLIN
ncbi:MAG: hypothetical protein PVG35_23095 [Desulfobacterales bacterium]|jgi:hypothetical protein